MNLIIMVTSLILLFVFTIIIIVQIAEKEITLNQLIGFIIIIIPISFTAFNSFSTEKAKKIFIDHTISTGQESGYEDLFDCKFPLDIGTVSKFDCYTEDRVYKGSISRIKRINYTVIKTDSNYIITVN